MNGTRLIAFVSILTAAAVCLADTSDSTTSSPDLAAKKKAAAADVVSSVVPKVGIRIGAGEWSGLTFDAGMDVTFKIPLLPLPKIRVDGEVWGDASGLGSTNRGNAMSLLGVQSLFNGYVGYGFSYYYTDVGGNHNSGLGLKGLFGLNLSHGTFVEAGLIIGPPTPPLFISIGERF